MNEIQLKILEDIFAMVPEGTFRDVEELQEFIEDEGTDDLFEMIPEGVFESEEQFGEFLTPLKKKRFFWRWNSSARGFGYTNSCRRDSFRSRSWFWGYTRQNA